MSAAGLEAIAGRRREIDGLRAIAVLAIVAFHAAPTLVPGGFVGVDVFFVISGFLITRIIAGEREEGRFSFARFYLRRARRILPAYLIVVAVVGALAYWLFLPDELQAFGWALGAAGLFLTNFVFDKYPGYFEPQSEQSPLLHLWSLSVEEQFYLVWPLLILALSRRPWRGARLWLAIGIAAASLAAAQLLVAGGAGAKTAFFHLPFRAWEFMLGGVLALGAPAVRSRAAAEAASGAGLALIAGSAALLTPETPFPGLAALPACLGAALAIWGGEQARIASAPLRFAPVAWVGLISYSLYLWHWPLLVFARLLNNGPLGPVETLLALSTSVLLAALTWRLVEQPWRGAAPRPRWRHLAYGGVPLALLLAAGLLPLTLGGLPQRLSPAVLQAAEVEEADRNPIRKTCFLATYKLGRTPDACRSGAPVRVIVWGDSHADALTPGVRAWADRRGYALQESAAAGCPPLTDVRVTVLPAVVNPHCARFNASVLREIAAARDLELIVLAARWPMYAQARPTYDVNSGRVRMDDLRTGRPLSVERGLDRTLSDIAATGTRARIVVLGSAPELPQVVPRCMARRRLLSADEQACFTASADLPLARIAQVRDDLERALARHPRVGIYEPADWLCREGRCNAGFGGQSLYFDDDHLSASAARWLVPRWIDKALAEAAP